MNKIVLNSKTIEEFLFSVRFVYAKVFLNCKIQHGNEQRRRKNTIKNCNLYHVFAFTSMAWAINFSMFYCILIISNQMVWQTFRRPTLLLLITETVTKKMYFLTQARFIFFDKKMLIFLIKKKPK